MPTDDVLTPAAFARIAAPAATCSNRIRTSASTPTSASATSTDDVDARLVEDRLELAFVCAAPLRRDLTALLAAAGL